MGITTTLENLEQDLKKKNFMDLAMNIVKYQKFKTNIALKKFNVNFKDNTKSNYFGLGIMYLKNKERRKSIPTTLYNCIDECLEKHVQALTPSVEEERGKIRRNYTRKSAIPPIAKLEIINKPVSTNNIEYGVKIGDMITLMPNREYARGFLAGIKSLKEVEAKVITVELGDINE